MDVLWELGTGTVAAIHSRLAEPPIAYTTALSTMTILERKGYVSHSTVGKANVYSPLVDRGQARRSVIDNILTTFFDDSPRTLMLNLLESERLAPDEVQRLRSILVDER